MAKFEVFKGKDKKWYWHLVGGNGEIMAASEAYANRWTAKRGAKRFVNIAIEASIVIDKK